MPVVFEEINGEVVPERAAEPAAAPQSKSEAPCHDPAEVFRRELQIHRERERRLLVD